MSKVDATNATLAQTNLTEAGLWGADLAGVDLFNADLSRAKIWGVDLTDSTLRNATMKETELHGANLWGADLRSADLSGAVLWDANLWGAKVREATFRGADCRNANFRGTTGLEVRDLARANVSGADLPAEVAKFGGIKALAKASNSARKLFITILVTCGYSVLTAFSLNTDANRLLEFPILGTQISPWTFFHLTPLLLGLLFVYFHIQMQRVWEELASLPAIFPDGRPIDQKVHPWLLTGLVRAHFPYLDEHPVRGFKLQQIVVFLVTWLSVPITSGFLIARFVSFYPGHKGYSSIGAFFTTALLLGGILAYETAVRTLRGNPPRRGLSLLDRKRGSRSWKYRQIFWTVESFLFVFALWICWTFVV
jgi:hypothetical protein